MHDGVALVHKRVVDVPDDQTRFIGCHNRLASAEGVADRAESLFLDNYLRPPLGKLRQRLEQLGLRSGFFTFLLKY